MKFELPKVESIPSPFLLCHPNIPKPLHSMNPRSLMGRTWWDINRKASYEKFGYKCWACGIHKSDAKRHQWLEAHESYVIDYKTGLVSLKEIVALCHYCHMGIHDGFLQTQVDAGKYTDEEYDEILANKEALLFKVDCSLFRSGDYEVECPWDKWRLVISGVKFKPKFKTYAEWLEFYGYEDIYDIDDEFDF